MSRTFHPLVGSLLPADRETGAAALPAIQSAPVALLNPRAVQPVRSPARSEIVEIRCDTVAAVRISGARIAVRCSRSCAPRQGVLEKLKLVFRGVFHALRFGMGEFNEHGSMVQELGSGQGHER